MCWRRLSTRHALTMAEIERALLLAGGYARHGPAFDTEAGIAARYRGAGDRGPLCPGYRLSSPPTTRWPATWAPNTTSLGLDVNSPTGYGERVYLRARRMAGGRTPPIRFTARTAQPDAGGGRDRALGDRRVDRQPGGDRRPHHPGHIVQRPGNHIGSFSRVSARLNYPLVRTRDLTVHLQGTFDAEQEQVKINTPLIHGSFPRPPARPARRRCRRLVRSTGRWRGHNAADRLVRDRRSRRAGATIPPPPPLSRQGADPVFQKLDMTLDYAQPVAPHLVLDLGGTGTDQL